jgi:hypothetical protein
MLKPESEEKEKNVNNFYIYIPRMPNVKAHGF